MWLKPLMSPIKFLTGNNPSEVAEYLPIVYICLNKYMYPKKYVV